MNDLQKAYCDGAAMAYKDCAEKMKHMIDNSPAEVRQLLVAMIPFEEAIRRKGKNVHAEVENFNKLMGNPQ